MPPLTDAENLQTQTQAIINVLVAQRNAALDQCASLVGDRALLEAKLKAATDAIPPIKEEIERLKARLIEVEADPPATTSPEG